MVLEIYFVISCRTYALKRGMVGASGTASTGGSEDPLLLPLWGQICCRVMAEPECATQLRTAGFVNVQVSWVVPGDKLVRSVPLPFTSHTHMYAGLHLEIIRGGEGGGA